MREPFCPQRGFLGTAFIVRIEEGDDLETLSDKAEMKCLDLTGDQFHPEWDYTIRPREPSKS
jgi:hypothetical protein